MERTIATSVDSSDDTRADSPRSAPERVAREVNLGDRVFRFVTALFAVGVVLTLVAMAVQMTRASAHSLGALRPRLRVGQRLGSGARRRSARCRSSTARCVSSFLALLIAVPISLGVAIYLAELAPTALRAPLGFLVELLAAIPSVVYGLWGIFVLAPWLRDHVRAGARRDASGSCRSFKGRRAASACSPAA